MPDSSKPSSNSSSPSARLLEYSLRATRFRLRLADLTAAVLLMLAMGVAGILAIVVADHLVSGGLSLWTRWTLRWIVIGAEACLLIAMIALPMLRRISNLYAARQMEKADPSFHNDLTAAVQLHAESGSAAATAAAVRRSASRQAARMTNGAPIQNRSVKLAALAAAAAVATLFLYWIFAPKSTATSLQRAMGLGDPPAPTRTQILSLTPVDETSVLTGDEVLFDAQLRYPQGPAVLQIARDAYTVLDEDTLTMTPVDEPGPGEAYRAAWKAISAGEWVRFRLVCGDAETPWRRMHVLPTPALRRVQVKCDWPKYTHLPPQISEGGRVEGPVGTQVTVTAETNLPVKQAMLKFESDGRSLIMEPDASGKNLTTTFRLDKPGRYVIHYDLRDIDAEAKSIPHDVVVTPDRPPTVQLDQPVGETTLAENESLSVQGEVTDDFGVAQVELVCTAANGQTKTHPLLNVKAPGASSRQLQTNIPAGSLGQAGETITCVVQARDLNPSVRGGQVTKSKPFSLKITPPQTTAEQQEAAGGQGLPHEAGDVPMDQAESEAGESQTETADTQDESSAQQAEAESSPSETAQAQPGSQNETGTQTQAGPGESSAGDQPSPQESRQLEQLCQAMQQQEQASENGANEAPQAGLQGEQASGSAPAGGENQTPDAGSSDGSSEGPSPSEGGEGQGQSQNPGQGQGQSNENNQSPSETPEAAASDGSQDNENASDSPSPSSPEGQGNQTSRQPGSESSQQPGENSQDESSAAPSESASQAGSESAAQPADGQGQSSAGPSEAGQSQPQEQGQQQGQDQQGQQQAGQGGESSQARQGAQGVHDKGGTGAGSQNREGELDAVDDDALMPGTTQPLKSVGEALDKARRQIKAGTVDPKLLEAMNMTAPQFEAFVEKYTDEYNKALQERHDAKETVKAKSSLDDDVKKGEANQAGNVTGGTSLEKQRSPDDRKMAPAAVSPEYQKQLEAYLRAVSEGEEKE